ncbi:MAG: DNA-binding protein [Planctomycetes bacterium]|nr:DNA-binding protein [Planctomycetota bacterium]
MRLALTVSEVARGMSVAETRVRSWIDSGELPSFQIGLCKGTRISVSAVEKFMQRRAIISTECQDLPSVAKQEQPQTTT